MSIPDPVTAGIVTAGALQVAKQAQDFIAAAFGHPGESLGTIVGNVSRRRLENLSAIGTKAHLILLDIGVKANEVPLSILQPALEAASLQEDNYLQDTWANLLANSADPRQSGKVKPLFPEMLKALSSREVVFLNCLSKELEGIWQRQLDEPGLRRVYGKVGLGGGAPGFDFEEMMDVLESKRILIRDSRAVVDGNELRSFSKSLYKTHAVNVEMSEVFAFTPLGITFVRACQKPER